MSLADEFDAIPVKPSYKYSEAPLTPAEEAKYANAPRIETSGTAKSASLADEFDALEVPKAAASKAGGATPSQVERASAGSRFAQGMRDPIDGGAQFLTHALPAGVVNAVNSATGYLNELPLVGPLTKALGITPATSQQIDRDITTNEQAYQEARQATGNTGVDWARMGGGFTSTLPLAAAMPTAAPTMLGRALLGAGGGATFGLLEPVTNPSKDYATEKGKQLLYGGIAGGAAAPITAALARAIKPQTAPEVQALLDAGVTPTPGQILGGFAGKTEEKLTSVPILGDMIKNSQRRAIDQFNTATYNRALSPIGKTADGTVGREGVAAVEKALSDAYENLLPKLSFKADQQFTADLSKITGMAQSMPEPQLRQFNNVLKNKVFSRLSPNGSMDGQALKGVESELSNIVKGYQADTSFDNKQLGDALGEVLTSLRSTVERANPQYAKELQAINEGWANYTKIRDAASRVGSDHGVFTPEQLQLAVRAGDKSAGKGAFARGDALLQDLSESGKSVLGKKYPDSGTVGRALMAGSGPALLAGYTHPFMALVGAGVGGAAVAPYTTLGQKLAAALLAKRPQGAEALAESVRSAAPIVGTAISPALIQALQN